MSVRGSLSDPRRRSYLSLDIVDVERTPTPKGKSVLRLPLIACQLGKCDMLRNCPCRNRWCFRFVIGDKPVHQALALQGRSRQERSLNGRNEVLRFNQFNANIRVELGCKLRAETRTQAKDKYLSVLYLRLEGHRQTHGFFRPVFPNFEALIRGKEANPFMPVPSYLQFFVVTEVRERSE